MHIGVVVAPHAGKVWTGCKSAKQAFDKLQAYKRSPVEMTMVLSLADTLLSALSVAEPLACRHEALPIIGTSVHLAQSACASAHALVGEEPEADSDAGCVRANASAGQLPCKCPSAPFSPRDRPRPNPHPFPHPSPEEGYLDLGFGFSLGLAPVTNGFLVECGRIGLDGK